MTRLVAAELDKINIRYEYLHGGVPSEKRKDLMENFTSLPESRVFISTDAGSTGLNLQAASILINLDLPWNPAVLEQTYRPHLPYRGSNETYRSSTW